MLQLQLFIEGKRVELHDDESVTLTQTIQDVMDLQKIFTDFTRTFSVPATRTNNKIFKHFYNFDVVGFDPTNKKDALLFLNYKPFKNGKIRLEGVQMANNAPVNYRITFFGNTVKLKDQIGEDKLSGLADLSKFAFTYTDLNIAKYMSEGLDVNAMGEVFEDAILVPLITHTQRLYYKSTEDVADTGNLHYGTTDKGVKTKELKPALRVYAIVKAIENKYQDIVFSDDFFSKDNDVFYNLYMWMHNIKGQVEFEDSDVQNLQVRNFEADSSVQRQRAYFTNSYFHNGAAENEDTIRTLMSVTVSPDDDDADYGFQIKKDGRPFFTSDNHSGRKVFNKLTDIPELPAGDARYTFHILTGDSATYTVEVTVDSRPLSKTALAEERYLTTVQGSVGLGDFEVNGQNQAPDIKVLDFLTGLFKMFNLTAYEQDGKIVVQTLDSFYASSTQSWDITEHLDITRSEIDAIPPYKEILMRYDGTDSFFAGFHEQQFNVEWGSNIYDAKKSADGESYTVELPFEHHKFERLADTGQSGTVYTDAQWGWSVDTKKDAYLGKPLLFYPHKVTSGTAISVNRGGTKLSKDTYYIPANQVDPTKLDSQSINFGAEFGEYYVGENLSNTFSAKSLYETYYKTYITESFDRSRRLSKFSAYLPLKTMLNLKLQDKIIIFNNLYKINKIVTNFETGRSELELVNEVSNFEVLKVFRYIEGIRASTTRFTADTIELDADLADRKL